MRLVLKQKLAGDRGFEPRFTEPESVVLPLDESPAAAELTPHWSIISTDSICGNGIMGLRLPGYQVTGADKFVGATCGAIRGLIVTKWPSLPEILG